MQPAPAEVIIIGAPRSGTNMLRDILCRLDGVGTWPCDEINLVWRHGNARWPSDAIPAERADARVVAYIRRAFERRRRAEGCPVVVEKTCANSLRVPFVDRVLPDARYLFIYRDPSDAVASARLRWEAPFELGYTLAKARFVPWSDLPGYALRFVANRAHRWISRQGRLAFWGPQLEGMDELLRRHDLTEVCALQWRHCVERAAVALTAMPSERVHALAYEDFVASPAAGLSAICDFLALPASPDRIQAAVADVSDRSVGKGSNELTEEEKRTVQSIAAPARATVDRLLEAHVADRG